MNSCFFLSDLNDPMNRFPSPATNCSEIWLQLQQLISQYGHKMTLTSHLKRHHPFETAHVNKVGLDVLKQLDWRKNALVAYFITFISILIIVLVKNIIITKYNRTTVGEFPLPVMAFVAAVGKWVVIILWI